MQGQLVNGPTSVGLREFSLAREEEPPSGCGESGPGRESLRRAAGRLAREAEPAGTRTGWTLNNKMNCKRAVSPERFSRSETDPLSNQQV